MQTAQKAALLTASSFFRPLAQGPVESEAGEVQHGEGGGHNSWDAPVQRVWVDWDDTSLAYETGLDSWFSSLLVSSADFGGSDLTFDTITRILQGVVANKYVRSFSPNDWGPTSRNVPPYGLVNAPAKWLSPWLVREGAQMNQ